MGEAINLVNNFKVEKVIFNCGEYNDLEKELINVLDKKKIKYYSCIKELNIDKNKLYFLQTKKFDNENDNSNVIYTELDGYKFMFMGDAVKRELKEELGIESSNIEFIKKYKEELNNNGIDSKEIVSLFIMYMDDNVEKIKLQKEEVSNIKWFTKIEMENLIKDKKVIPHVEEYNLLRDILK